MFDGKLRALKPCPFCGGEKSRCCDTGVFWVSCDGCGTEGPVSLKSKDEAIGLWNGRSAADSSLSASSNEGWRDIASAPKDGTKFQVWADGYEWPEVVFWQDYDPETAAEVGLPGYFRYAEDSLADSAEVEDDKLTYWRPLPPPPSPGEEQTPQSMEQGR